MARASRRLSKTLGDKSPEDVSDAEIRALVSNNVAERQYLDFKVDFDHKLPDARPKLLRHVASFANGGGGYLILGIRDDGHGRAQSFEGLQGNVESIGKSIRSLCLKYLDPRITGLEVHRRVVDGHAVVLVRIPRSARVPHMMTFLKANEICSVDPEQAVRALVAQGYARGHDIALQLVRGLPYARWRDYDTEATVRFYALRLREVGMITSTPQQIIAKSTDWRFLNELKKDLKG